MKHLTKENIKLVKNLIGSGVSEPEARKKIRERCGLSKSQGNFVFNRIKGELKSSEEFAAPPKPLQDKKKYIYNPDNDCYVFNLKNRGEPTVFSASKIRAILRSYSEMGENLSSTDICRKYGLTPEVFTEIRSIFSITKDREPLTFEDISSKGVDENVNDLLEHKRLNIYQKYEKSSWQETQKQAEQWRKLQFGNYDPMVRFIEQWTPPKYTPIPKPYTNNKNFPEKTMLINVGDIHVGARADERFLYRQKKWSIDELTKAMFEYGCKINEEISSRKNNFSKAVVCLSGDIIHTLTGYTDFGTKLETELCGEDQIDFAFNLLVLFINNALTIFPEVEVKSVNGNHSYLGDYLVSKLLSVYFKDENRVNFEITNKRYLPFHIGDSLVVLDHGAAGKGIKSKLPRQGATRDSYIKSILLDRPEMLVGVKSKIFLTNDKHHYEHIEKGDFDVIISPSIVGGDLYSDFSGWKSRPAQCMFVFDEDGLKETIRFYFD